MIVKFIVIVALLLIVGTLGSALYYLYHDRGQGTRMVKALAIRVALSASLVIFLLISYKLGWIGETGLR
ncbi:MAG: twin transmembrane helix small protein [Casimicrobiaceae bacterium]